MNERFHRVTRQNPCPICGKPDWCAYNSRVAICMRVQSPIATNNGGWLHKLTDKVSLPPSQEQIETKRASNEVLDSIYRKVLDILSLSSKHQKDLENRGMTSKEIQDGLYKTLPGDRYHVACQFTPEEIEGVPGFGIKKDRVVFAGRPGLLIPCISPESPEGHIVALVNRPDIQEGGKYMFISSRWLERGASPGAPLHIANPKDKIKDEVYIVEGPLKANIVASRLRATVIAVPGVANWKPLLKLNLPQKINMAFDSDYENFQVRYHARALANALLDRGHDVKAVIWDKSKAKGPDDALVIGLPFKYVKLRKKALPIQSAQKNERRKNNAN